MDLATSLKFIKGVGPGRATMFEAKGLHTVEDLLSYFPFRYEDRSNMKAIAQLAPGEMATVVAEVRSAKLAGFRRKDLGLFEAVFSDASRAMLHGKWFHGKYLAGVIAPGQKVALFGKVEYDTYSGNLSMLHPEMEILTGEDDEGPAALHVPGIAFELNDRVRERVKAMLPFKPTGAQKRVLLEIAKDMEAPRPMNRLLQGDVGSGKTIVAAEAGVIAIENGYQVAVLAPTEILANQHYIYLKQLFSKLGYVVALITGAFTGREKTQLKKLLAEA